MECCGLKIRTRFLRSLILILIAEATGCWLFFPFIYRRYQLPISATPQKKLLRWIVQRYRTKLLRAPPSSLTFSAYSTVTLGSRFNVSSERLLVIFSWPVGDTNPQPVVTRNIVFTSPTLYLLSYNGSETYFVIMKLI